MKNSWKWYKDKILCIFLLITLVFFGAFIKINYTTDTYAVIEGLHRAIFENFLQSGRFITAIFFAIFVKLHVSIKVAYVVSYIVAIFAITLSIYKTYNLIKNEILSDNEKKNILVILISILLIINPFSIELMIYIEKGIMALSILFSICAVEKFVAYLKEENKKDKIKNIAISALYILLAVSSYQGTVGIFVVFSAIFILKYSKTFCKFVKNTILNLLVYGIPALINLIFTKFIFKGSRVSGERIIPESIKKIIDGSKSMVNAYGILPKYSFLIFIDLALIFTIIIIMNNKNKILNLLKLIYVILITYFIAIAPQAMQATSSIWMVARSTYTFASIIVLIQILAMLINEKEYKNKVLINLMIVFDFIFIIVEMVSFNAIEVQNYQISFEDKQIALRLEQKLEEYEKETGIKVNKIAFYEDKSKSWTYRDITKNFGDVNLTAFATDWSDANMINYYTGRNLTKVEKDEEIEKSYKDKDFITFSDEEILIKGDTVHFCKF